MWQQQRRHLILALLLWLRAAMYAALFDLVWCWVLKLLKLNVGISSVCQLFVECNVEGRS